MPEASASGVSTILAFDYGRRRIGVAVGQSLTGQARPLEVVAADGAGGEPDWPAIERLVGTWRPQQLLVGLPLGLDGEETDMSRAARIFGDRLADRFPMPVDLHDERFTSVAADERFRTARQQGVARRKQAADRDAVAAALILESWLASNP